MHHARQPQVVHIGGAAGHLGRDVDPLQRLAHEAEASGAFSCDCGCASTCRMLPDDQLAIAERAGRRPAITLPFSARSSIRGRLPKRARRLGDQDLAHLRGGMADRRAAVLHGLAAGRIALVRRPAGIGGDQR